jgi:hypothetical protein
LPFSCAISTIVPGVSSGDPAEGVSGLEALSLSLLSQATSAVKEKTKRKERSDPVVIIIASLQ